MRRVRADLLNWIAVDCRMRFAALYIAVVATGIVVESRARAGVVPSGQQCMGRWVGRGQNSGYTTYWGIELNLTAPVDGSRCGTIEYTNPECGGTLEACTRLNGEIHIQESYTHQGTCAPPAKLILKCEGDEMRFSWIGWETVTTTLHRPGRENAPQGAARDPGPRTPSAEQEPRPSPQPIPAPSNTEPTSPSGGCGCSSHANGANILSVVLALALLRRRREA